LKFIVVVVAEKKCEERSTYGLREVKTVQQKVCKRKKSSLNYFLKPNGFRKESRLELKI